VQFFFLIPGSVTSNLEVTFCVQNVTSLILVNFLEVLNFYLKPGSVTSNLEVTFCDKNVTSLILVNPSPTQNQVDLKNPPLPGEVSYLLCSLIKNPEARGEDPPRKICIRCCKGGPLRPDLSVCFFISIKPENPYFASRRGLEVKPLAVYPRGPRSSSCGPPKGTPPPRTTVQAN